MSSVDGIPFIPYKVFYRESHSWLGVGENWPCSSSSSSSASASASHLLSVIDVNETQSHTREEAVTVVYNDMLRKRKFRKGKTNHRSYRKDSKASSNIVNYSSSYSNYVPVWPGHCPGRIRQLRDPVNYALFMVNLGDHFALFINILCDSYFTK